MRCRFMAMNGHGNRYRYGEGHLSMCGMDAGQLFFVCHCYFGSLVPSRQQVSRFPRQWQRKRKEEDVFFVEIWTLWQRLYGVVKE